MENMTTQEAVVSTTATEQIIAAALSNAQAQQDGQATTQDAGAQITIDEAKKQELERKFQETINNPRFWAKANRYDALMDALVVPAFDDKSLHMYHIHSESDLMADAAKKSIADGLPAVLPTEEEVKAEVWRRWIASETENVTKALNKKRREEAKREGRKFTPVPTEDVKVIVAEAEAKLRAAENC
ncbi:MAG TPA: hypothetical protein VJ508_08805 [Saprospiraceae bacterium]|nr:hypothetical protein [Saprospiraceae bacterium]